MFRFTIRELVLVTALVAVAAGWWLDHRRLAPAAESRDYFMRLSVKLVEELEGYRNKAGN